jgi:hypothetical protein
VHASYVRVSEVPFFTYPIHESCSIYCIDAESTEIAWVQAGTTIGEVYYRNAEKSKARPWLSGWCLPRSTLVSEGILAEVAAMAISRAREYGLLVDNINDAQLVDVKGRLLDKKIYGRRSVLFFFFFFK